MDPTHVARHLERALADDLRTNELGVRVTAAEGRFVLRGEVACAERRDAVLAVLREHQPDTTFVDLITLSAERVVEPHLTEHIESGLKEPSGQQPGTSPHPPKEES